QRRCARPGRQSRCGADGRRDPRRFARGPRRRHRRPRRRHHPLPPPPEPTAPGGAMIARLVGTLVDFEGNRGIVDVHGGGGEVCATSRALAAWSAEGSEGTIHVSTQVREDAITLYGFPTALERQAFGVLLGVSGVGPKLALACLEALSVGELARAAESD